MKKHITQSYYLRKITKISTKQTGWSVSIPPEYVEILKLDNDYVEMQIVGDMLILKKNKKSITKKDLEKINTQNISKETTAHTIKNEIEIDERDNSETIVKESKKEPKIEPISKLEIKQSPSEKPESSTEKQDEKDRIDKIIEDSISKVEF